MDPAAAMIGQRPNSWRPGYWRPGNYWRFLDQFNARPMKDLRREEARLERAHAARLAYGWPHSNYRRALQRSIATRARRPKI